MSRQLLFLIVISATLFAACQDNPQPNAYRLAKASSGTEVSDSRVPEIQWETPENWEELPAFGFRTGSFKVAGEDEGKADISVIFLPQNAGTDLANVNRWRQQIGLPPIDETNLTQMSQFLSTPLGQTRIVEFSNDETAKTDTPPQRIIAAILPQRNGSWFFKIRGHSPLVASQRDTFIQFIEGISAKGSMQQFGLQ